MFFSSQDPDRTESDSDFSSISSLPCMPNCFAPLSETAQRVQEAFQKRGIESPFLHPACHESQNLNDSYETIKMHVTGILRALGLNLHAPDLEKTPHRIAKMYAQEVFYGLNYALFPTLSFSKWESESGAPCIDIQDIEFHSHCMHHFVPMQGKVSLAYYPTNQLIGLSKVHRLIDFLAARPQIQELFTVQCLVAFQVVLETPHVRVRVQAMHGCVRSRGVCDSESTTYTEVSGGHFLTKK